MSSVMNREQSLAFGFRRQTDIATANILGDIWRLNKLNPPMVDPDHVVEDDAAELGKGNEFATTTYPSHNNIAGPLEKYNSAEFMAWCAAFGLGTVVPTGTTPGFIYTCTPIVPVTSGIELPYFSYLQALRQGGSVVLDQMFVGCALNDFLVSITTTPGRAASKIMANWIGSGKITEPSSITHPAKTTEEELPGASAAINIQSQDYVALKDIVSLEWGWNNHVLPDDGFFPGSGTDAGFAKRGRIEYGTREAILRFTVRLNASSSEYTKLKASTTGTAVITQTFDSNGTYTATFHQVGFRAVKLGETNGVVTVAVEGSPQWHSSNGILTVVAKCNHEFIGASPA